MANLELESLRAEVDNIDAKIVDLLASRFRVTSQIGKLKAVHALDAIDPEREAAQEARFRELAQRNGLNADLVVRVFRSIIDEVVSNHREANPSIEGTSYSRLAVCKPPLMSNVSPPEAAR